MRRSIGTHRIEFTLGALALAGCMTIEPAPLVSNDSYRFGVASRLFHRDISEVAEATRKAMRDLSFQGIQVLEEVGSTRIEALTGDNRRVRVDLEWARGTPEGAPLPISSVITGVRVKVGESGERDLSRRLLDRMSYRLENSPPSSATPK